MLLNKHNYSFQILMEDLLNKFGTYLNQKCYEILFSYHCHPLIIAKNSGFLDFSLNILKNRVKSKCQNLKYPTFSNTKSSYSKNENISKPFKCELIVHINSNFGVKQPQTPKNKKTYFNHFYKHSSQSLNHHQNSLYITFMVVVL